MAKMPMSTFMTVSTRCSADFSPQSSEVYSQRLAADSVLTTRPSGIRESGLPSSSSGQWAGCASGSTAPSPLRRSSNVTSTKMTIWHTRPLTAVATVKGTRSVMSSDSGCATYT